jgi:hypothetical protein
MNIIHPSAAEHHHCIYLFFHFIIFPLFVNKLLMYVHISLMVWCLVGIVSQQWIIGPRRLEKELIYSHLSFACTVLRNGKTFSKSMFRKGDLTEIVEIYI